MSMKFELFAEDGISMRNYFGFTYEELQEKIEHTYGKCDFHVLDVEDDATQVYIHRTGQKCRLVCYGEI